MLSSGHFNSLNVLESLSLVCLSDSVVVTAVVVAWVVVVAGVAGLTAKKYNIVDYLFIFIFYINISFMF